MYLLSFLEVLRSVFLDIPEINKKSLRTPTYKFGISLLIQPRLLPLPTVFEVPQLMAQGT